MKAKDLIIKFVQDLEKLKEEGCCIAYKMEIENIGITELKPDPLTMWKEYVDLGSRKITIHINVPNTKTIEEVML